MDINEQIKRSCIDLPFSRVTVVDWRSLNIPTNSDTILYIFASWSGLAAAGFRIFTKEVAAVNRSLVLLVLDTDTIEPDAFQQRFGSLPQGKGESYWFKGGTLVRTDIGYTTVDVVALRNNLLEF